MLSARLKTTFLLLALAQAAHSVEEFYGRLWEVFAPAQFLTALVSPGNPVLGFLVINIGLVTWGFICYFAVVRAGRPSAPFWIWFWILLESVNAVGHTVWAAAAAGYTPGLVTALPFFLLVPLLVMELQKSQLSSASA